MFPYSLHLSTQTGKQHSLKPVKDSGAINHDIWDNIKIKIEYLCGGLYVKRSEILTALNMHEKLMAKVTQKLICINGKLFFLRE